MPTLPVNPAQGLTGQGPPPDRLPPRAYLGLFAGLPEAQAEALSVTFNSDYLEGHHITLFDDLTRMGDAPVHQLRYVDQPLNRPFNPGEGAKGNEFGDGAGYYLAHLILIDNLLPLLRLGATDAEGYLLGLSIHFHDEDIDLLADFE